MKYTSWLNVTFHEFYTITLKTKVFDEHYQMIHILCSPCTMKYNFIGKMETLLDDANKILREKGLEKIVQFPTKFKDKYKESTKELMKTYYSKLPQNCIKRHYEIYKEDFLSFGYEMTNYLYYNV